MQGSLCIISWIMHHIPVQLQSSRNWLIVWWMRIRAIWLIEGGSGSSLPCPMFCNTTHSLIMCLMHPGVTLALSTTQWHTLWWNVPDCNVVVLTLLCTLWVEGWGWEPVLQGIATVTYRYAKLIKQSVNHKHMCSNQCRRMLSLWALSYQEASHVAQLQQLCLSIMIHWLRDAITWDMKGGWTQSEAESLRRNAQGLKIDSTSNGPTTTGRQFSGIPLKSKISGMKPYPLTKGVTGSWGTTTISMLFGPSRGAGQSSSGLFPNPDTAMHVGLDKGDSQFVFLCSNQWRLIAKGTKGH